MVLRRRSVERRYQIASRIATGTLSEIYEARAEDLERPVAIKRVMPPSSVERRRWEAEFMREAAVIATLDHPNVLAVLDVGQHRGDFLLVTELVEGLTLRELLDELSRLGETLDADVACGIVGQLARGLGHAHERAMPDGTPLGIVHRDVAPDNILLSLDGVPKLIDFGLATLEGHEITEPGTVRGRPRYLSPEQARAQPVDARTDVFALGAVMFELLSGEPLYTSHNESAMLWKVQKGDFDPLAPRLRDGDPDLIALLERALASDPEARFPSARELERALDRFRAARGLRVDQSAIAAVARHVQPRILERREKSGGDLVGREIVLAADLEDRSGGTDPALEALPDNDRKRSTGTRPKRRMERLERPEAPRLERPPSLGRPENPAGGLDLRALVPWIPAALVVLGLLAGLLAWWW